MRIDFFDQFQRFQIGNNLFARGVAIHADVGCWNQFVFFIAIRANRRVDGKDVNQATVRLVLNSRFLLVPGPDLVIVEIMCGGNLDATGTKFGIDLGL